MKRWFLSWAALAVFLTLGGGSLVAQRGGGGRAGGVGGGAGAGSMAPGGAGMGRGGTEIHGQPGMDRGQTSSAMGGRKSPGDLLAQNTKLSSRLETMLPEGTDAQDAAAGFKNLGRFVAAVHVSKNLGIPFEDLKAKMTWPGAEKLGKAIHDLKLAVNAKAEAKKAKKQAKEGLKATEPD